jgi:membrane protein
MKMIARNLNLLKSTIVSYIEDDCLSRGASIAFYTITSLAPVLIIIIAIAGLIFGEDAARGAVVTQLTGIMGQDGAHMLQTTIRSASNPSSGILASIIGVFTLLITASGVFGEMQSTLNRIWKTSAKGTTFGRLIKSRTRSLGLVVALGLLLMVSLLASAVITNIANYVEHYMIGTSIILHLVNFVVSFGLVSLLFATVYKVLPDTNIAWRDVVIGAITTGFLFEIGKFLIGIYLGSSTVASSYGAAGALMLLLLWIYYSSQIFLLGAEFTKVYALHYGSKSES